MKDPRITLRLGTVYMSNVPDNGDQEFSSALLDVVGNANYHRGHRRWVMPLSRDTVSGLKSLGMVMPPELEDWEREQVQLVSKRREANRYKTSSPAALRSLLSGAGVRMRHELFDHQVLACAYALKLPACALLMDTGTGKTAAMATVMQALVDKFDFKRMLVIAPKTILNTGWGQDLDKFSWLKWVNISNPPQREPMLKCPLCDRVFKRQVTFAHMATHMRALVDRVGKDEAKEKLYTKYPEFIPPGKDDKRTRLLQAFKGDARVFLINPESFKIVLDDIMDQEWDMCTVDESSMLKSPKAKITQRMQLFAGSVRRRVIMTATPRPNTSLDLWGQMAFVDQSLGGNFYSFRNKHYYQDYSGFNWIPKEGTKTDHRIWDVVSDRSYRVKLEDCVDLPGETTETMSVELDGVLKQHYKNMLKNMVVELQAGRRNKDGDRIDSQGKVIDTQWQIVQMNKLSQITSGYIFDNEGNVEFLADSPKIKATLEMAERLVENEGRSVVIWARFAEEMRMLEESLSKYGVSTCHGRTKNVDKSVAAFKAGETKVMIAHARSAQFGHTWTHANVAIFHSYDYSWEALYQAKRRIYRIGQKLPVTYVMNVARGTVDEEILARVFEKEEASEAVVDDNVFAILKRKMLLD